MSLHLELAASVSDAFGARLAAAPELTQDALILHLPDGLTVTVRYAAADAYSLRWNRAADECAIDTAPLHRNLATFPNHFHDAAGRLLADPVTDPSAAPAENLARLVGRLLDEPGFGFGANG